MIIRLLITVNKYAANIVESLEVIKISTSLFIYCKYYIILFDELIYVESRSASMIFRTLIMPNYNSNQTMEP